MALAARIAERLSVRPRPHRRSDLSPGGTLQRLPFRDSSAELDLELTLERIVQTPHPGTEDFVALERRRPRQEVVLALDVSGSMRGERVRAAVATVAALASVLRYHRVAVVAFGTDAVVLGDLAGRASVERLVTQLLGLQVRGLTNVTLGLDVGRELLLSAAIGSERRVLLLSDMIHNAGPDPRPVAARVPRVDVLLDATGQHDADLAREVARAGRGVAAVFRSHRGVPRALEQVFGR